MTTSNVLKRNTVCDLEVGWERLAQRSLGMFWRDGSAPCSGGTKLYALVKIHRTGSQTGAFYGMSIIPELLKWGKNAWIYL